MQKLLQDILRSLAVRTLARYEPVVVAVAGSVGKTSTRRAVAAVLGRSFRLRESPKNFNNEIGVPLTILGIGRAGGRSPFAWAAILWHGLWLAFGPKAEYPNVLVLEMATDHPGDMANLAALAPPDVAVMTAVAEEHTEFLGDLEGVAAEEGAIVAALGPEGRAVLNADDPRVLAMRTRTKARIITYGMRADLSAEALAKADVGAGAIVTEQAMGTFFTRFDLLVRGKMYPVNLSNAIGRGNVYAAMAAAAAALAMGLAPDLIPYGLAEYQPPPGRLRAVPGIKGALLIDDTYNSSPSAAELALRTFSDLPLEPGGRRIAALGDMLELGALTEESHRRVGRLAAEIGVDALIGVGPRSQALCEEAVANGLSEDRVFHLHTAEEAGHFLQERVRAGDLILIKGSQGMRMEKAVKDLMAEPERAGELLVRQGKEWN